MSSSGISSIQITYVANKTGVDTRAFEGYASLISSIGQLVGVVSSSLWLILDNKTKHKRVYLLLFASVIGIIYFVLNSIYVTIPMYIFSSLLNGASYGIYTNILLGIVLGKMFSLKRRLVTPVGVYNTMLAIGIFCGIFVGCIFKQGIFDQMHGFSTYSFKDFKNANMSVNILGGLAVTLSFGLFMLMKLVNSHNRKKKVKIKKEFGVTTGTEM